MSIHPGRLALLAAPLLLAACSGSGVQNSARILDERLQERLAKPIADGQVALTPQADGATVTLLRPPPPPNQDLDDRDRFILASTIEGLLDPSLMQVQVADTATPPTMDQPRVRATTAYFQTYGIGATPGATPTLAQQGLTIAITVHCPPSHDAWNWGYDEAYPTCW
jgi:hypothetical protein